MARPSISSDDRADAQVLALKDRRAASRGCVDVDDRLHAAIDVGRVGVESQGRDRPLQTSHFAHPSLETRVEAMPRIRIPGLVCMGTLIGPF